MRLKIESLNRVLVLMLTIAVLMAGQSVWAQYPASIGSIQYNSTLEAYEINSVANLNDLAVYVNGTGTYSTSLDETTAHSCEGMTFKVTADITIPYTTDWDDATSTEDNYTPVGGSFNSSIYSFKGTFDGRGHTVSGIRIYRSGNGYDDRDLGLFGAVYGTVKNVTVSDMRVTGYSYVGGIAGYNTSGGKIVNCHATATVALHALQNNANYFGGIVGFHCQGFISGCSSAVTLTVTGEPTQCMAFGGIVGVCDGDMRNCLAVGVRLPAIHYSDDYNEEDSSGAIAGNMCQNHAITDNYYSGCYLDGTLTENGIGVGNDLDTKTRHDLTSFKYKSITYTNCAVPATTLHTFTVGTGLTAAGSVCPQTNGSAYSIIPGTEVTLGYNGALDSYQLATYSLGDTPLTGNTFTMPDADATAAVNVVNIWNTDHEADGSAEKPFIISTTQELDELARRVNNGTGDPDAATGYSSKYFELGDDITYSTVGLGETESNYTPIGNVDKEFYGNFDGKNKTVSGIRIYRGGNDWNDGSNLGLFGNIDGSIVQNVTVSDARITGYMYVGGIAGYIAWGGTIRNCHTTSTVSLHAVQNDAGCFGGIAGGNNRSTIDGCTSAATIGKVGDISDFEACGGIVGQNNGASSLKGVIQNCLALGVNVTADDYVGAIVGSNSKNTSLGQNYYNGCTVGTATTGIGCNGVDITDNDGAVPAKILSDVATTLPTLAENDKVVFRRLFTAGKASTVCLPFDYTPGSEGDYYTFSGITKENGKYVATMTEAASGTLAANTPYLFMPAGTEGSVPVTFIGMASDLVSADETTSGDWTFTGTYTRLTYGTAPMTGHIYGFAAKSKTVDGHEIEAGDFVHAKEGASVPPMRCYLTYKNGAQLAPMRTSALGATGNEEEIPSRITVKLVSSGGVVTSVGTLDMETGEVTVDIWYDMSGRPQDGEPTAPGLYIHKGKTIMIKE